MTNKIKPAFAALLLASATTVAIFAYTSKTPAIKTRTDAVSCAKLTDKGCVFKTLLGLEDFDKTHITKNKALVDAALSHGLEWMAAAQSSSGGWGSGSHSYQEVMDPHAVEADPATTSLVGMALLRNEQSATKGKYSVNFNKAVNYLLKVVEQTPENASNITQLTDRQPQVKLGRNIDVILTAQFFTNYLQQSQLDAQQKQRVDKALQKCVAMIQRTQDSDGSWKDGGWAPVLQSALANNALESAKEAGIKVDDKVLEKSKNYQKKNYDTKTNSAITGKAAGVLLYSVSGSARASAKEAQMAEVVVTTAKKNGKLKSTDKVSKENLVKAGMAAPEAEKYIAAYEVNKAASKRAQDNDVINGFGNNGGEEFLSYLMTGESLVVSGDNDWKKWYDITSGRLLQIQNNDGSWNGHHCITSPVFCTATCLLILSIDKDIDFLIKVK
jgi:hypothetical protein